MREIPKPGERYRHFKNKEYQILAVGKHSETGEKMVVYQALYGDYGVWVRPLSMFMERVDRAKYPDVRQTYRFERVLTDNNEENFYDAEPEDEVAVSRMSRDEKYNEKEYHEKEYPNQYGKKNDFPEEVELHPLVEEFLDQDTTEGKLEILQQMSGKVTRQDLDSICFCLDMNPVGGSVEEELDAIRQCIRMQQRYDAPRLRYKRQ